MPSVLTHKSIMLLARERIAQIRDALEAKRNTSGVVHTDLEAKILDLARQTHQMLSEPPHPTTQLPGPPYVRPFGEGVSKFAVMGAMGPDITAFSGLFAPGQAYLFDTIHKGNPDGHREMVAAGTCEFAIEFWRRASVAITAEAELKKIRAYVLGHLCHLAGDIVSHPFINDLEWHQSSAAQSKLDHQDGEVSHDASVAQKLFRRRGTREGAAWDAWWPTVDEVPRQFFSAYADTFEEIYVRVRRRTGFTEFEDRLRDLAPPSLTPDLIKDGYTAYRNGIVSIGYGYGAGHYFGLLLPITLPLFALPIIAAALPHSKQFFNDPNPDLSNLRSWFDLLLLPVAFGSFAGLFYGGWVAGLSTQGVETRSGLGIVSSVVSLMLSLIGVFSINDGTIPDWLRFLMIAAPSVIASIHSIIGLVDALDKDRKDFRYRGGLSLIFGAPVVIFLVAALVIFLIYTVVFKKLFGLSDRGFSSVAFWIATGIWVLGLLVLAIWLSFFLRDVKIPETPQFPVEKRHHVRLFDDMTLYTEPGITAPTLAQSFFPAGRRKLLKLHWTGAGDLFIRSDRFQLVFSFFEDGRNPQFVPAPVAPMTLVEFIHLLESRVVDSAGATGNLKADVFFPRDIDYELPAGAVFADHGDREDSVAKHDEEAAKFKKLARTAAASDYFIFHAPKPAQSIRFGKNGPLNNPFGVGEAAIRLDEDQNGYQYVFDPVTTGDSETIMSLAADLAALLCLGGASHMGAAAPNAQIHQVFRNWCLDRRRENEWRMLVAGGAFSEKGGQPDRFDPLMLRPTDPVAYRSRLATASAAVVEEGERTTREMGWVPLLRQWLDMTQRPNSDPLAETRLNPANPTNHALSRGLAFLLDMSDPVRV